MLDLLGAAGLTARFEPTEKSAPPDAPIHTKHHARLALRNLLGLSRHIIGDRNELVRGTGLEATDEN